MGERKITNKNSTRAINTLIIVAIVAIAVVVVGVGVYVATRGSGTASSTTPTPEPTVTATSSPSTTATPEPTSTSTSGIATATSYEFNETGTASNGTVLNTQYYAAKNIRASNAELLRVVTTPSGGTVEVIVNGVQQKAWEYGDGKWTDISVAYGEFQASVQSSAGVYVNMLTCYGGSGGYTYTIPSGQPNAGDTATFTNIQINPSLPDSMFQPTG